MFESKNMKKIVIYLTIIAVVCFGLGFLIYNFTGGHREVLFNINSGNILNTKGSKEYELDDEKNSSINEVSEINAESACADINIIPEKRSDVKVKMYGSISATYEPKLALNISGGSLEITTDKDRAGSYSIYKSNLKLDVYIPENYNKTLSIKTSSGNIDVNKINLKNISAGSASGTLKLNDINCENLEAKSTSGAISGSNITVSSADVNITSGSMNLSGFKGDITGNTVSGKINIDYSDFNNNIELNTVSGDIELSIPAASQFKVQSKSVSGKISCKFPVTIEGSQGRNDLSGTVVSDKNRITLNTTSGSIDINKK